MADREKVVEHLYDCIAASKPGNMWVFARKVIVGDAIVLLKEQERTTESATWMCHLYRCGSKRFECSWCHGTAERPSNYCPECRTKMDEKVVDMDD